MTITGDLNADIWSWQPSATVDGVHIANPAWAGKANLARHRPDRRADPAGSAVRRATWTCACWNSTGRAVALYRDAQGRATWDFSDGKTPDAPLRLPPIRKFVIDGGQLNYRDEQRKLTFSGTVDAKERWARRTRASR